MQAVLFCVARRVGGVLSAEDGYAGIEVVLRIEVEVEAGIEAGIEVVRAMSSTRWTRWRLGRCGGRRLCRQGSELDDRRPRGDREQSLRRWTRRTPS